MNSSNANTWNDYLVMKSNLHKVELFIVVCVVFYDTHWLLWALAEFIFSLKTTLLIHLYTQTGTINRTHSQQTISPYSPTDMQMYHFFVLGKPQGLWGQRLSLRLCFLTESLFIRTAVLWSGPIPDYPPQLQELQNGFIICLTCLMRESMESVCSDL